MMRILLADDEEAITSGLGPFLERSGFDVAGYVTSNQQAVSPGNLRLASVVY